MTKVLITGGSGFIGSNLIESMPDEYDVYSVDNYMRLAESELNSAEVMKKRRFTDIRGDVRDFNFVKNVVCWVRPDYIYSLAAQPSNRLAFEKDTMEYFEINVGGTVNFLEACKDIVDCRFIYASSNKVYGHQPVPHHEGMIKTSVGPYALSKATSEDWCRLYADFYGVSSVAVRFHHAVGKRCHSELALSTFARNAYLGKDLLVNGKIIDNEWKSCSADFTNVGDICRGLVKFTLMPRDFWQDDRGYSLPYPVFKVYNFGTGRTTTVLRLAELVVEKMGSNSNIIKEQAAPHEGIANLAVIEKAKKELGWSADVSIENSVGEFIEWFKERVKVSNVLR